MIGIKFEDNIPEPYCHVLVSHVKLGMYYRNHEDAIGLSHICYESTEERGELIGMSEHHTA